MKDKNLNKTVQIEDFNTLKSEIEEKNKQLEETINLLKRVQADFENYIKRIEKEKIQLENKIKQNIFLDLLKIVDSFESALSFLKKTESNKETITGIENMNNQIKKFLENHHLKEIHSAGEKLDPFKHEVIKKEESEEEENTIIKEIQKGYFFNGDILRPSKVIISNGKKGINNHDGGKAK